jgi:cell division protein FtsI (penicillin-binding protein 3)
MLTFYNAIANGGRMVKPTLKTGEIEIINPQIANPQNIQNIQTVLKHVVSQGLGRKAGSSILSVAGKTGTSQVGEYDFGEDTYVDEYQLAFCGYFPADAPKYSIIVSMNKLGLPASGGGMAGVVFHDIVEWMITHSMPPVLFLDDETNDTIRVTSNNVDSIISNSLKQD